MFLRDHPDGRVRPQPVPDFPRDRCGGLVDDGAHRARPGALRCAIASSSKPRFALGLPTRHIIARHIVPNVLGTVIVYATLTVPQLILFESFLSFLGLGVQEPLTSLGRLVAEGALRDGKLRRGCCWCLRECSPAVLVCLNFTR
jgi:hypothetical protein